jgi:spermidine synthase
VKTLAALLFVISGTTALIYEVVWARSLGTLFGASSLAQITVLSTWFLGLALGHAVAGPFMDRRPRAALLLYGVLELLIGLYGLLSGHLLLALEPVYARFTESFGPEQNLFALKVGFASLALLLPTALMGATLPALVRALIASAPQVGRGVGQLYFLNSIGAAFGALFANLWLVPVWGALPTLYATGAVNLAVGACGIALSFVWARSLPPALPDRPETSTAESMVSSVIQVPEPGADSSTVVRSTDDAGRAAETSARSAGPTAAVSRAWLFPAVAFSTGAAALLIEVAWTRTFAMVFGSSTQAFSLMLTAFIGGIALGGLVATRWLKPGVDATRIAARSILLGAACIVIALPFYEWLPFLQFRLAQLLERRDDVYPVYLGLQTLLGFAWMLPFTLTAGVTLPALAHVYAQQKDRIAGPVGTVFAANTLGTVLAPFFTSFVALPSLGLQGTLMLGAMLLLAANAALLWHSVPEAVRTTTADDELDQLRARHTGVRNVAFPAGISLLLLVFMALTPDWNGAAMHAGGFRRWTLPNGSTFEEFRAQKSLVNVLYELDGAVDSVVVVENHLGERFLKVNGKTDASDTPDLATQQLVAHIPLLLHRAAYDPGPRQVFVVGVGSGVTVGSAALHDHTQVVTAELSEGVLGASRYFDHVNGDYSSLPNVEVHLADAREWLQRDDRRWDIIINQPSNPWVAGNGALFSREFFEMTRDRLAPNGIMTQWMHVYAMDDEQIDIVLQTFASVYPHVTMWWPQAVDMVLIGSMEPLNPDLLALSHYLAEPDVAAQMDAHEREDLRVNSLDRFLALQVMSATGFRQEFDGATPPFTTDAQPLLEYRAPRTQYTGARATGLTALDERLRPGPTRLLLGQLPESPAVDDMLRFFADNESPFASLILTSLRHAMVEADDTAARWREMAGHADGLPGILEPWTFELLEAETLSGEQCRAYFSEAIPALARRSSVFYQPEVQFVVEVAQRCTTGERTEVLYFRALEADLLRRTGYLNEARALYDTLLAEITTGEFRERLLEQARQLELRLAE